MAEKFSKKLAVEHMAYTHYRKKKLDKFKYGISKYELWFLLIESNAGFIFDGWLIDNGIVPVSSFEKWRKSQIWMILIFLLKFRG